MKIKTKKCPGCGKRIQYIEYDDGTGWFQQHKKGDDLCDEKPKKKRGLFSRLFSTASTANSEG